MLRRLLLICAVVSAGNMLAQTIVSTSPENRKVILEEFTGIYCGYCPDGHAIAQGIKDDHPDDVFLVNIHQGGFANPTGNDPDFTTQWGDAIANQTGLLGYPAGTVNRMNFPGIEMGDAGTTALGRFNWEQAVDEVIAQGSYVNLAVEATVDIPTNSINIHVEAYYTGDSPESTNMLNVAILQNNTLGPQSGGNQGNNYNHMHRLIDLATGQWGEEITTTTQGTFVDRTYNYSLPFDVNGVYIDHNELEIVVFMAESSQTIVSGNETIPDVNPLTSNNDASLLGVNEIASACNDTNLVPEVVILNSGFDPITSLDFTYSVNGGAEQSHSWTGSIASLATETIELPTIDYTIESVNTVDVSIGSDDFNDNNSTSYSFDGIIESGVGVTLTITTDQYADEISWELLGSDGTVLESEQLTSADDNQTLEYSYELPEDCITFNIADTYGDGIINGGVSLVDVNGLEIYPYNGNYGFGDTKPFESNEFLGTSSFNLASVEIYPNPASNLITVSNAEGASVEVFNLLGQMMTTKRSIDNNEVIDLTTLSNGTYLVKITKGSQTATQKLVVLK